MYRAAGAPGVWHLVGAMPTTADLARNVARSLGSPGLPGALASLASSRLKSLLMHVAQLRSRERSPADLVRQARRDRTVEPCAVDLRQILEIDQVALEAFATFDAVDLSMLQPAATSTVLGAIDQNSVLATIANTEIIADPTSSLALQAAARRAGGDAGVVRLCTSARVLRMQRFDNPSFTRHFRLFAAVTAGRDRGAERFEMSALREHLGGYLAMMAGLSTAGYRTGAVSVEVTDLRLTRALAALAGIDLDELLRSSVRAHAHGDYRDRFVAGGVDLPASVVDPGAELADFAARHDLAREVARLVRVRDEVFAPLAATYPDAGFDFAPFRLEGGAYYRDYCFRVYLEHPELGRVAPGDGGFTTWTARLSGNRKERLLTSGLGTELIARLFADR